MCVWGGLFVCLCMSASVSVSVCIGVGVGVGVVVGECLCLYGGWMFRSMHEQKQTHIDIKIKI